MMNHRKPTQNNFNNDKGYTIIEIAVVLSILGILVSIGVPRYAKFVAKSRQAEAKTNLGSLYAAEKAFAAHYTFYHTSFQAIGFSPEGKVRYNLGFHHPGEDAGISHGFNPASISHPEAINTLSYCGGFGGADVPGNSCFMLNGADGQVAPALQGEFTTYSGPNGPSFIAGAAAMISTPEDDQQMSPEPQASHSKIKLIAEILTPEIVRAAPSQTGNNGNGVGNTGPGNQGNDSSNGYAGGNRSVGTDTPPNSTPSSGGNPSADYSTQIGQEDIWTINDRKEIINLSDGVR